jgi:hypothetical protein
MKRMNDISENSEITPQKLRRKIQNAGEFFQNVQRSKNFVGRNFYCAQQNFRRECHAMLHRLVVYDENRKPHNKKISPKSLFFSWKGIFLRESLGFQVSDLGKLTLMY